MPSDTTILRSDSPRVIMGVGRHATVAAELQALGAERVLVISTPRRAGVDELQASLGARCVGVFDQAKAQVPLEVAEAARNQARQLGADWVVARGGGTPIGVAKAVALEVDVRIAAIPTTYAGSEMTEIYGITTHGDKVTGRDPRVRPRLIIYDPTLVATMPKATATTSLVNALAHSVEALWDENAPEALLDRAEESVRMIISALRGFGIPDGPTLETITDAQYGAYLAAWVLNDASMALHHKLAHVLGGSFGTPHAETHTILLPHTLAHNAPGAPEAVWRLRQTLETADPTAALWDLLAHLNLPVRLSAHGFGLEQMDAAIDIAMQRPYPNPVPLTEASLRRTLEDAVLGRRPSFDVGRLAIPDVVGPHGGLDAAHAGAELADADRVVIVVHGRGGTAETMLEKIDVREERHAWVALQAANNTWYPKGFKEVEANRTGLQSILSAIDATFRLVTAQVPPERVVVLGWSQGACVVLSWLATLVQATPKPGGVVAWTGAAIPGFDRFTALNGLPVYVGTAERDPWVAYEDTQRTVNALKAAGAAVRFEVAASDVHEIRDADQAALQAFTS